MDSKSVFDENLNQLIKNVDWQKHIDNLNDWFKENSSILEGKLNIAKDWIMEHSEELQQECQKLYQELFAEFQEGCNDIKAEWSKVVKNINSSFEKPKNLKKYNYDFLKSSDLLEVISNNKVNGSNQAGVFYKVINKDNLELNILYVCYLKDGVIINNEDNVHMILLADAISREIKDYFKSSKLIIIK